MYRCKGERIIGTPPMTHHLEQCLFREQCKRADPAHAKQTPEIEALFVEAHGVISCFAYRPKKEKKNA